MADSAATLPVAAEPTDGLTVPGGLAARPEEQPRTAASDAATLALATYGAQGLFLVAGLVQKGLLGPVGTGYWAIMQAVWPLLGVASLGAAQGTTRQIPLHRGRRDYATSAAVADTGISFSLAAYAALGILLATVSLIFGADWAPEIRYGLILLGLSAPLRFLSDSHETLFHATKRFRAAAAGVIVQATVALTIQTLCVYLFGFYGMFIGVAAAALASLALYRRMGLTGWRRPAFHWRIDRKRIGELIAFGFPLLILAQIWVLFMGIDSFIVAGFLDVENLGYYALAVSVSSYLLLLPKSIGAALFPRILERYGRTQDIGSLSSYAIEAQRILAHMLVPVFIAAAFFLLPVLTRHVLPAFEPSIPAIHIMVSASFFIALCNVPIKILITAGKRLPLIILVAACLAFNAGANYLAVGPLDWGIEGAAGATAVSYFAVFLATTGYGLKEMVGARQMVAHVAELLAVFVYLMASLWAVEGLLGPGGGPLLEDLGVGMAKLGIVLLLLSPWVALVEKRYGGLTTVASLLRTGLQRARAARRAHTASPADR